MNPVQPTSSTPCSKIGRNARHCRSFTLIELLVVVAIMMILAALLFPAVRSSLRRAEVIRAKHDVRQLVTGFEAFYSYYKCWPTVTNTDTVDFPMGSLLVRVLTGGTLGQFNRSFCSFDPKKLDAGTNYVDPWGNVYQVRFDFNDNGQIPNPFESSTSITVSASVLVWSAGPDKTNDTAGESSAFNKDNIKSWAP